ncbi:MAG: flagellar type III secretion system pore protein FliP [Planctomycetota bacterium]|jgi:flagellar biosynthetic protein FliP
MDCLVLLGQALDKGAFEQLAPPLQVAIFLGALSFAMGMLVSVTAFTRIIIVLSFVRRALTTQEIPPNPVILGLSLFLTLFVMAPTIRTINETAVQPYLEAQKLAATAPGETAATPVFGMSEAWENTSAALRSFMLHNTREADLQLFVELSNSPPPSDPNQIALQVLVPAFVVSELKTAFIMGFCIYIPFLLIDLVVSTVLMSLGMMMMPPVVVATPCKLLLFILVDGWQLISRALVTSFGG